MICSNSRASSLAIVDNDSTAASSNGIKSSFLCGQNCLVVRVVSWVGSATHSIARWQSPYRRRCRGASETLRANKTEKEEEAHEHRYCNFASVCLFLLCLCRVNFPTTTILCSGVKKMPGRKEIIDKYPLTVTKTTLLLGGDCWLTWLAS